ncbi:MAG: hypothetical protein ACRDRW_05225 [Pseudonocardiaceae bacterium]
MAGTARDTYGIANAAWHAGMTLVRTGHPNDALKLVQLGGFQLRTCADDLRVPTLAARLARAFATAYAAMGGLDATLRRLAEANDGWKPRDAFERAGADLGTAAIQRDLGRLDTAEGFAASAVRMATALEARPGTDTQELARTARQIATTV